MATHNSSYAGPVRVYLDSSDIDNLTDHRKLDADPRLAAVADELKQFSTTGVAQFRFSFFHLLELAHLDEASKPFALRRAELLKSLCGKKAFLHPDKLYRIEALSLAHDNEPEVAKGPAARAYIEDAGWLPDSIVAVSHRLVDSFIKGLENRIAAQTQEALRDIRANRRTRRSISKNLVGRKRITAEAIDIAAKTPDLFLSDWKSTFPLTKTFWAQSMPFQYLKKKITLDTLRAECVAGFADIDNFIGWCIDKVPSIRQLPKAIRGNEGAELFEHMRQTAEQYKNGANELLLLYEPESHARKQFLKLLQKDLQKSAQPNLSKTRAKRIEQLRTFNQAWFKQMRVANSDWDARVKSSLLGALPSFDTFPQVVASQFRKMATLSKDARKHKPSDLSDMLHCIYLPYVDLFRADEYMRSLIADIAKNTHTTLVPNTVTLPQAIRNAAAARGLQ